MNKLFFVYIFVAIGIVLNVSFAQTIVDTGMVRDTVGHPLNGTVVMHYKVYQSSEEGTALWDSGAFSVRCQEGFYSVPLGTTLNPLDEGVFSLPRTYYLEQIINDEILKPRKALYYTPQAVLAKKAIFADTAASSFTANIAITANHLSDNRMSQFDNDAGYITQQALVGLTNAGAGRVSTIVLSTNGFLSIDVQMVVADALASVIHLTLPLARDLVGKTYTIKKSDASKNKVWIHALENEHIDNDTLTVLSLQYEFVSLISDGINWLIIGGN